MFLVLVFVMLLAVLGVLFFVGSLFAQSFIFTEPTEGMTWRAPTAAGIMAVFFTFWCFLVVRSGATPANLPYDTINRFKTTADALPAPAEHIWAYTKGTDATLPRTIHYRPYEDMEGTRKVTRYKNVADPSKTFTPVGVDYLEVETAPGLKSKFDRVKVDDTVEFKNDKGWTLPDDRDLNGVPVERRWSLLIANLLLNLVHFVLWFVCLWLILRFSVGWSLLFGAILWAMMTVALLPMLLDQAATR